MKRIVYKKDITIKYACLKCRKVFKKYKFKQSADGNWHNIDYKVVCPDCSSLMYETGSAFKAPAKKDKKSWGKLSILFKSGHKFHNDFGNPFLEPHNIKPKKEKSVASEFRKPARKRQK